MLPEELLWVIALSNTATYYAMVTALPQLARRITLGTQCDHKIHFGYDVKVENDNRDRRISWRFNGKLHRINEPAVMCPDGSKYYFQNGKLHRTDGSAVEYANGSKEWYLNGKQHRTDGPAVEWMNGTFDLIFNGTRYRDDDSTAANGYKAWYQDGELHRTDGPAIEHVNGAKSYYLNGKKTMLHLWLGPYQSG